ncbi:MAG: response regulator [Monoglobaceae bacterium]
MYKIILVDDERFAVKALANVVKWNDCGFELCGVFTNGFDCIEYVKNNPVDALITDIRMPQMDGIELIEEINKILPNVKVILMSAYKDFDYALKAIKQNVFDYLVKPIECKTVENMLRRLEKELMMTKENYAFNTVDNIYIQKLLYDFTEHKNNDFIRENITLNNLCLKTLPVILIKLTVSDFKVYVEKSWEYGIAGAYNAVNNIVNSQNVMVYPLKYSFDVIEYIMFFNEKSRMDIFKKYDEFKNNVIAECFELLDMSVQIDIIKLDENIEKLAAAENGSEIEVQKKIIISLIEDNDIEGTEANFRRFCDIFFKTDKDIKTFCAGIINDLINLYGVAELNRICGDITEFYVMQDAEKLKAATLDLCLKLAGKNKNTDFYDVIKIAKKYVEDHIECGITLAEVADVVAFSTPHFGRIFKEKTGEKFSDYVNRVRIEKAEQYLLTTGMRVCEIYEKVGYKSRNHFYSMFKLIAGCSPQEYRNKMSKNIQNLYGAGCENE